VCFQSRIFHNDGTKAFVVSISCQLTQSYVPAAKTRGSLSSFGSSYSCVIFYHLLIIINGNLRFQSSLVTLRHLSVVCYDVSYRVSYRGARNLKNIAVGSLSPDNTEFGHLTLLFPKRKFCDIFLDVRFYILKK